MCTMDYVTHVLGLQGWERAHKLDNYFCGEEDLVPTHRAVVCIGVLW